MDKLLKRLESDGYGCWIGSHYFGSVSYADDLKLLSPTIYGLRKMTSSVRNLVRSMGCSITLLRQSAYYMLGQLQR